MGAPTDPIADFLTIVRNGVRANKDRVTSPVSNRTLKIAEILKQERYIDNFKLIEEGGRRFVRIHLRYLKNEKNAIKNLKRISKPGIRHYVDTTRIPRVMGGLGMAILSTSKGMMCDREARRAHTGGEVVCEVW